jgi:glycosyltransferase involved in cell wall biosynthesis
MEFRSIGDYGKIQDIKFVCGPCGGGEFLPKGLKDYAKGNRTVENVRLIINYWCRFKLTFTGKLKKCDYVMFANKETHDFLVGGRQSIRGDNDFFSDAGLSENDLIGINNRDGQPHKMIFLVAGRLIYRKGHKFLFDVLSGISPELDFEVRVVGTGEESQNLKSICAKSEILSKYVTLVGGIPYTKMAEEFNNADVLIMPSIRETTGNVLLEAMSKGIPVITIKKFGGKVLLDDETAFLYEGTSKEEYINNLRSIIVYCVNNPKEVKRRGSNARLKAENHTWEVKNKHFQEIYRGLLNVK